MMVQKYCPTCKDLIPVACKSCPCGHKFSKTVAEAVKTDQPKSENDSMLGREENGRPRRRSAMNSLYYHSSLQLSSYRIARHAAVVSAKRKSSTENSPSDTTGAENNDSHALTNGHPPKKRKRGRPRLTPLPESGVEAPDDEKEADTPSKETKKTKEEEDYPTLRRRRPGLIYNTLRSARDLYDHPSHSTDSNSKTGKSNRAINESESYGKLYQTLSEERKTHFSHILSDINFKFKRNANFPLEGS